MLKKGEVRTANHTLKALHKEWGRLLNTYERQSSNDENSFTRLLILKAVQFI